MIGVERDPDGSESAVFTSDDESADISGYWREVMYLNEDHERVMEPLLREWKKQIEDIDAEADRQKGQVNREMALKRRHAREDYDRAKQEAWERHGGKGACV